MTVRGMTVRGGSLLLRRVGELYLYEFGHRNSWNVPEGSTVFYGILTYSMGFHGPNKEISAKFQNFPELSVGFY